MADQSYDIVTLLHLLVEMAKCEGKNPVHIPVVADLVYRLNERWAIDTEGRSVWLQSIAGSWIRMSPGDAELLMFKPELDKLV